MGKELDNIDLTVSQRKEIAALLKRYLPDTEVWAYGSRVKFTAKPSSDLDIVAFASKEQSLAVANLKEAFEESSLPFRVDFFIWDEVPEQFHKNIETERVILQEKPEQSNLPEGWTPIIFSDAVDLNPAVKLKKGDEYPFVDMASVDPSRREVSYSEFREFKSGGAKFLPRDTLMARITPCLENGKIARYMPSGRNGEAFGSTEFIVIRGKDGVTDNDFAYYLTMWPEFREFAISQMTGSSGRQRVPVDSLAGFNFNLPPLTEQKAIAHILGSLDDKIELNRRMNETLETMAQALFKSWFVDFDPVIDNAIAARNEIPEELKERAYIREALGDVRKKLPEEIHNLFPSEFEHTEEMGWIPKGWEVGPLAEIARLETKSVQPGNRPNEVWTHFSIPAFDEGRMPKKELGETIKSGKYIVPSTAVLASKLNPQFPRVWLPDVDSEDTCICSTEFMPFVPLNDVERPYLYAFLRSKIAQSEIVKRATGSTGSRQRVKPPEIAAMPIVIPSKTLRERFCSLTGGDYQKLTANMKNIKNLTSARESLLPKLLSGEIRIPEAEKLVEDLNKNGGNNGKS